MDKNTKDGSTPKSESVFNQFNLLRLLSRQPESVDEGLRESIIPALSTQGKLAAFDYPARGIVGMSLNTHKAIAEAVIDGGYETLDNYRRAALEKLKQFQQAENGPGRGTIEWYKSEIADKNKKLDRIANDIALMTQHLDAVLMLGQRMAQASGMEDEFNKLRGEVIRKFRQPT